MLTRCVVTVANFVVTVANFLVFETVKKTLYVTWYTCPIFRS
jgi:hypothetical protein